jgi:predicted Zn-dependent protease
MSIFGGGGGYNGPRRGSGGGLRLIIAALIALVGIIGYFTRTQTNPVTGEKQHISLTADQEVSLGLEAAPQMASQMGGEADPRSDKDAAVVNEIGQLIVDRSDAKKSPYRDAFRFHLLNDPQTVNAFALPGGQVFITRALYDRLENTAQLAGVLGHEIGHVIGRHSAEHMAKSELGSKLTTAVAVGASDRRGQMAAVAAAMANQMLQLHYSRDDELEADHFGLRYMAQSGFSPAAMRQVMQILKKSAGSKGRGPNILSTHPDPDARIAAIEEFLQKNYPNGVPSELTEGRRLH